MAQRKVAFWRSKASKGNPTMLTAASKAKAKRRAEAAGRAYPNLVDNAWAARAQRKGAYNAI